MEDEEKRKTSEKEKNFRRFDFMDIEIKEYTAPGYSPVIDYESWRVAVLNDIDELEVPNLKTMQKHTLSDEVFVLLKGSCTLFSAGNGDSIGNVTATKLEPLKMYNIKADMLQHTGFFL